MTTIGILSSNKEEILEISQVLQENHYTIQLIVNNPKTARLTLMKQKPDIIIADLPRVPFQHLDIIQDIHYNKMLSEIPIIGFGRHTEQQMLKKFTSVGIIKYLLKPLKYNMLLHILEALSTAKFRKKSDHKNSREYTSKDETKMLLDPDVLSGVKIEHMVKKVDKLISFPFTIAKFIEVTSLPQYSADDLVNVIKLDAGLSSSILKAANSVEYGSYHRVTDFKEAIMRIGFEETKKIVISIKVMESLPKENNRFDFNRDDFWYHSICNALIAEKIAKKIKFPMPSYAFLTGLLHDYPTLLFDEYFGGAFDEVLAKSRNSYTSVGDASKKVLGFLPCEFIVDLAQKWGLPNEVINALRYHKSFIHLPSKFNRVEEKQLITIIGISEVISKVMRVGKSCDEYIYPIPAESLLAIKFNAGIQASFVDSIPVQIEHFCRLLGLKRKQFPERLFSIEGEEPMMGCIIQSQRTLFEPHLMFLELSDISTRQVQSIEALTTLLDSDSSPELIFMNELPEDPIGYFDPYLELLEMYPASKIIFVEEDSKLTLEEDSETRILPKSLDIMQIIQAIDSFTINLEEITS